MRYCNSPKWFPLNHPRVNRWFWLLIWIFLGIPPRNNPFQCGFLGFQRKPPTQQLIVVGCIDIGLQMKEPLSICPTGINMIWYTVRGLENWKTKNRKCRYPVYLFIIWYFWISLQYWRFARELDLFWPLRNPFGKLKRKTHWHAMYLCTYVSSLKRRFRCFKHAYWLIITHIWERLPKLTNYYDLFRLGWKLVEIESTCSLFKGSRWPRWRREARSAPCRRCWPC